jgi:DnaK suppressor protein
VKKPLKTSSKTAVKKNSSQASAKAKAATPVKKQAKPAPAKVAPKKAVTKLKPVAKKAAPKAAAKPSSKPSAKPVAKPTAKTVKPASKPVAKTTAKNASKAVSKTASKVAPKVAASKPASKAPVKAPIKALAKAKTVAKPAAKPILKASAKPVAKAAAKPAAKPVAKPVAKPSAKTGAAAPSEKSIAKAEKPAKLSKAEKAKAAAPVVVVAAVPVAPGDVPARAVRPSARLAQITVPSMAQSVASTAAKASYLQNEPTQVLTPPPFVAVKKDPKLANNWKTKKPDQLTDAEVMAMSDKEYMNDAQMAFFRIKLVQLKQGILINAGETTEHLREDTVVVPDPADRATIEEEHALELRTRDRERKLLKKIEQSIQRIDSGDYGYCDETGEPIGVGRLLARPTANLSLEAQQRRELKQKMFGD